MTATTTTVADDATAAPAAAPPRRPSNGRGQPRPAGFIASVAETRNYAPAGEPLTCPTDATTAQDLLRQHAELPAGHPDRAALRTRSIEAGLPLARRLADRYRGRGEPLEDLYQVAALALIKAVDGYDANRETAFTSYAVPTIVGALKRHFRDATWRVRVPRRVHDLATELVPIRAALAQQLGRSPTVRDLAARLNTTETDVAIALDAWQARHPDSLDDLSAYDGNERRPLVDTLGAIDARFDAIIDWSALRPMLTALTAGQRRILAMRYFDDMTQADIAAQVGMSQMQISRLLTRTLAALRAGLLGAAPPGHTPHQSVRPPQPTALSTDPGTHGEHRAGSPAAAQTLDPPTLAPTRAVATIDPPRPTAPTAGRPSSWSVMPRHVAAA